MAEETLSFQAEVSKLLDIVAHSLYSHREIFLRELISNAADACDKLRYEAQVEPGVMEGGDDLRITLITDAENATLAIADNGIGMNRDELVENLGTIARSGTAAFVEHLAQAGKDDTSKDMALIGQFGVGFYSAFMVAKRVDVLTRRAGDPQAWRWSSDGKGTFTIEEAEHDGRGTTVVLHLQEDAREFLEDHRIRSIVTRYSDHISAPIDLAGAGEDGKAETLNTASALWTRPKGEIDDDQYKEFYHHVAHAFDEPWLILHNRNEGVIEYTNLLFVPSQRPFDIFHPDRKQKVRLYVKRVFITDDCEALLPGYLRFLRGIVDAQDLPLNISREMLQNAPVLAKIRQGLTKRVLGELKKKADGAPEEYAGFWDTFGAVLKEGLYEDFDNREKLLDLSRFGTTSGSEATSLAAYVERMKDGQEAIFYITGDDAQALAASPHLEGFRAKGVEVLLLDDPIDEFWVPSVGSYEGKAFRSVTRGAAELGKIAGAADEDTPKDGAEEAPAADVDSLLAAFKATLGDAVKDVRRSERLTESAVCLVADETDMDMHLQRMLRQSGQLKEESARILEVNAGHPLIRRLAAAGSGDGALLDDAAFLLLDQARILEGETVPDPLAFARRMSSVMEKGINP